MPWAKLTAEASRWLTERFSVPEGFNFYKCEPSFSGTGGEYALSAHHRSDRFWDLSARTIQLRKVVMIHR
jgi:hypothetical protein